MQDGVVEKNEAVSGRKRCPGVAIFRRRSTSQKRHATRSEHAYLLLSSKTEAECLTTGELFGEPLGMNLVEFAGGLQFGKGIIELLQKFGIVLANGKTK